MTENCCIIDQNLMILQSSWQKMCDINNIYCCFQKKKHTNYSYHNKFNKVFFISPYDIKQLIQHQEKKKITRRFNRYYLSILFNRTFLNCCIKSLRTNKTSYLLKRRHCTFRWREKVGSSQSYEFIIGKCFTKLVAFQI